MLIITGPCTGLDKVVSVVVSGGSLSCSIFLRRSGNIKCRVIGNRQYSSDLPQGGLELLCILTSIHTVVCRAAQEAGAQPREYIDRKKENAIFAPPYLCAALMKQDKFCCVHSLQLQYSTFQI